MKNKNLLTLLSFVIAVFATIATTTGIFSQQGPGPYKYTTIRGQEVTIYGKGLYQHMSAEIAPQGIAQDYVTLFIAIPVLFGALIWMRRGSLKGYFILAGCLGYFFLTYLFYLMMAMYNSMFLIYVVLVSTSFFALIIALTSTATNRLPDFYSETKLNKLAGGFLIFSAVAIASLWLSLVIPPLLDRTIIPVETEHYTTLVVQGLDLALFLPASFIIGLLFFRKKPLGYLLAPVYLVFLTILMTALSAKIITMSDLGYNVVPAIFIIPAFNLSSLICTVLILKQIKPLAPKPAFY
jgi:hypothetical protein